MAIQHGTSSQAPSRQACSSHCNLDLTNKKKTNRETVTLSRLKKRCCDTAKQWHTAVFFERQDEIHVKKDSTKALQHLFCKDKNCTSLDWTAKAASLPLGCQLLLLKHLHQSVPRQTKRFDSTAALIQCTSFDLHRKSRLYPSCLTDLTN